MIREQDLGKSLQATGRRIVTEGQATSQRFHDWKRVEKIPAGRGNCGECAGEGFVYADADQVQCDQCNGTGDIPGTGGRRTDTLQDRQASRLAAEWTSTRRQLERLTARADWLMDQARGVADRLARKDWTPAQAEAGGWCGSHWRIGEEVPITLRPTGEPWYAGRCRRCGSWPEGDPPREVLETWRDGKTLRVKAS